MGIVAAFGLILNITKTLVFGFGSLLDREMISLGIIVGICTIPGGLLGKWIVKNTDIEVHAVIVEILMLAGGCYFFISRPLNHLSRYGNYYLNNVICSDNVPVVFLAAILVLKI